MKICRFNCTVNYRNFIPFFSLVIFTTAVHAQAKDFNNKLSPLLAQRINSAAFTGKTLFRLMIAANELPVTLQDQKFSARLVAAYDTVRFYMINATAEELTETVLPLHDVLFIDDGTRSPKEEVLVNNLDLSTNKISTVHSKFPQWNGDGFTVSVKENRPDTADIDFAGRYVSTSLSSSIVSTHATNMATMIAGAGNSWYLGKGAAPAAVITSSNFANLLPDPLAVLHQYNITIQNHSYGVGIENFYGADAALYDADMIADPVLMEVFSSGNSGSLTGSAGTYAGINGFANLTGSFKMAKNILTVGATDSFGIVAQQSSKGPAFDGRVKPELTAFGIDGSSGSAALVTGVSLMLQQQYKQLNGTMPANALIKAVLLNSADDRGNKEVDYSNGFGTLNALNAVRTIQAGRFFNATVGNGSTQLFSLPVPPGLKKVKITLVWNDPPAVVNAAKALLNDLDLELTDLNTGQTWQPWVLNKFPHIDSLKQLAVRRKDSINNVEQVTLDNPLPGNYQVTVKGYTVNTAAQKFYIAYQFDSTGIFEWHFPTVQDPVFPSAANTLRWNSTFAVSTGKLDFSTDNGTTWQMIDPAIDLTKGYYNWNAPAVISAAMLKMTVGATQFITDTFLIMPRIQTGIGFNCPDSFLFYWHRLPQVSTYRIYTLGNRYLEPVSLTSDSFVVLKKNTNPSLYYAVAPVIAGKEGVKSYTLNYTIQGVDCYIRSFLATLVNNTASLSLSLGSLYNITGIVLEKYDGYGFRPLQQVLNINSLQVDLTDNSLSKGLNRYRFKVNLSGGAVVYSLVESVFYFENTDYVLYPNPAGGNTTINLAQEKVDAAIMEVFNAYGAKIFEMVLDDRINKIPAGKLSKGFYFVHILKNGARKETLKLIVY